VMDVRAGWNGDGDTSSQHGSKRHPFAAAR
jgi:hypothetical protein